MLVYTLTWVRVAYWLSSALFSLRTIARNRYDSFGYELVLDIHHLQVLLRSRPGTVDIDSRRQRQHLSSSAARVVVMRRTGCQRTVCGERLSGSGEAEFFETSFELNVETAVEDRVDGTVEQSQSDRVDVTVEQSQSDRVDGTVEQSQSDRVDGTVEQSQSLGESVDGFGDLVAVLGPNVNEMNDKVRRPATNVRADDTQRHLAHTYVIISTNQKAFIEFEPTSYCCIN